ncbi:MAG: endonuclease V [Methanobacteriales archaeon]|nr:endonuclease V [Methanobacteriales archaeon]
MCSFNLIQHLYNIQNTLARQVISKDCFENLDTVAGVDVSFSLANMAVAAAVVLELDDHEVLEKQTIRVDMEFPYIPGFLGFREVNATISVLEKIGSDFDVLMVNGHGILHPRGFGLASHVGVLLDVPTLGVAKRLIKGRYIHQASQPYPEKETAQLILDSNQVLGAFFRRNYVSVGHKISLNTALEVITRSSIYYTPEPLRQAHLLATETFKQKIAIDNII